MRVKLLVGAVVATVAVGGCTAGPPPSSPPVPTPATGTASAPTWTEPAKYGFVLDRQCSGGPSQGRYRVAVAGGRIVTADRIDGRTAEGEEEIDVPTLRELLDMAQAATDDGGAVTTTVDPKDGHPTAVSIDVSDANTADSVACFTISDYAVSATG